MSSRSFCVTWNNPPIGDPEELPLVPDERYVVWQGEQGDAGNDHLQIYIELTRTVRFTHITKVWPGCHVEKRRGTREQARDYCRKEDSRTAGPYERGEWASGGAGTRNDLAEACALLKEGGIKRVAEEAPTAFVKFHRGFRELARELEELPGDADFVPRYWQQALLDQLSLDADDRTIHWVTDTQGGKGKSRLGKHLVLEHNAIQLSGRIQDMAYMYSKQPIVIFDVTRAAADHSDHLYSFAEQLKNGIVVCTKYESRQVIFKPPHVIFFANFSYDREKWSTDRVIEWDLNNPDLQG